MVGFQILVAEIGQYLTGIRDTKTDTLGESSR